MRAFSHFFICLLLILSGSAFQPLMAQLGFDLKIDKPEPYDNRVLRAEKTGNKALKPSKKFFQNLTTRYNYYFNASNKLNEVIDEAKTTFRDDYTELLSFYNYTLDATSQNTLQLDSVIYKSQTGLVMHDLRNDWADNMYLLWGAAWFFEKEFDSAALMFQFINYAFAEKEKDGYYKYIGSRLDGNNALSIATDEKKKSTAAYGSRNNAFLWQIRTFIEAGRMTEAGTLIATLKNDPFFPTRLKAQLEEVEAYWYYKQKIWDSSAVHLVKALDNAGTKQELARWEYLAAQMFERTGDLDKAQQFYSKSINHTTDPVMDVYSRLNVVRVTKDSSGNYIDRNVGELLKMARRDKYADYRDVIYYMAAQMELERNNYEAARDLLLKASKYNNGNLSSKSRPFLMIADLAFDQKKYLEAAAFYDSVNIRDIQPDELKRIEQRKPMLSKIVAATSTISREDSLQRIAALPEDERADYVNKLLKRLLKEQGISDATLTSGNLMTGTPDMFQSSQNKGEWYFYNTTLKTQGAAQFKQVWGNRPNVDNWRRFSSVNQQLTTKQQANPVDGRNAPAIQPADNTPSFSNLMANLPLTEEQVKASNDSISNALFSLGNTLLNEGEDYLSAIDAYEKLRSHYPSFNQMSEVLFNLYYAYLKAGNRTEADKIRQLLLSQYPTSRYAGIVQTGKDPQANNMNAEATKVYEDIYNLFIEGRFDEAEAAKKIADSTYRTNHWEPQLLYIEAVYHIRQREDSIARKSLQTLIAQDPKSAMAEKARTMIDVLNRRSQIEAELAQYQIQHVEEEPTKIPSVQKKVVQNAPVRNLPKDTTTNRPPVAFKPVQQDTTVSKPVVVAPKDTVSEKPVVQAPPKKDTVISKPVALNPPVEKDPVAAKPPRKAGEYYFDRGAKHFAVIILDKVDPLFAVEVKNAYSRFNREHFRGQFFDISVTDLTADKRLVLVGSFNNIDEALNYMRAAKASAATEVMPWLKADKYTFSVISADNLSLLLEKKDIPGYEQFLDRNLPGK